MRNSVQRVRRAERITIAHIAGQWNEFGGKNIGVEIDMIVCIRFVYFEPDCGYMTY